MRRRRPLVLLAIRIVDHADIGHATIGPGAIGPLLPDARGIQAHVRARPSLNITLPVKHRRLAKRFSFLEQLLQTLASVFGHSLDRRLTDFESTQLAQGDFARLGEAGLDASDADHLRSRRAERPFAEAQFLIPRKEAMATLAAMVIVTANL